MPNLPGNNPHGNPHDTLNDNLMEMPLKFMRQFFNQQLMPFWHQLVPYNNLGPRVEVSQTPEDVVVTAELPGLQQANDVDLLVQETAITISGKIEREETHQEEGHDLFHSERMYGTFTRTVPLPVMVDPEQVQASYRNGLLTVKMRKNDRLQGKKIRVEFQ